MKIRNIDFFVCFFVTNLPNPAKRLYRTKAKAMPICLFIYFTIVHSQLTRFRPHANDFDTVAIPLNEFKHNKALLTRHDAPCPINRSNFYSCIVCKNSARLSMTCTFWVHTDTVPCSSDFRSNASHRIINRKKPYLHILPCLLK